MAKQLSELKKRALIAKQRLKMGYWQKMEEERRKMEKESVQESTITEIQRQKVRRDIMFITNEEKALEEERLYKKVCLILDKDEHTLSPIGQLIDKDYYKTLSENGKQKYILELSEKFRELSKRYYLERDGKTGVKSLD